jgi:RES domain-containing protein
LIVRAFRISRTRHADSAFTGEGAERFGGRWNNPGSPIVYTAGSISLAVLEVLVRLNLDDFLETYSVMEASFDDSMMTSIAVTSLPKDWRRDPPPAKLQHIGQEWMDERKSVVLRVPSAVVPSEWNYLLNPRHPLFAKISIGSKEPFDFDPRLKK